MSLMSREFLAEIDPIVNQIKPDGEGNYCFHPTEEAYPLILLNSAIDIVARIDHSGLQEAIKLMCGVFDLVYTPPEGWRIQGVVSFAIKLVGQRVDVELEINRYDSDKEPTGVTDVVNHVIELANKAERIYLCRILSGINVNMPVWRNRDLDFVFSYKDRMLDIRKVEE